MSSQAAPLDRDELIPLASIVKMIGPGAPTTRTLQRWARVDKLATGLVIRGGKKVQATTLHDALEAIEQNADTFDHAAKEAAAKWSGTRDSIIDSIELHNNKIDELVATHESLVAELRSAHEQAVEEVTDECERRCETLRKSHGDEIEIQEGKRKDALLWGRVSMAVGLGSLLISLVIAVSFGDGKVTAVSENDQLAVGE